MVFTLCEVARTYIVTQTSHWSFQTPGGKLSCLSVSNIFKILEPFHHDVIWVHSSDCFLADILSIQNCNVRLVVLESLSRIRLSATPQTSAPGSSDYGILQARILEGFAISFSRGIFPTRGSNLCLLHCQADSLPLSRHQGSPCLVPNRIQVRWIMT